MQLYEELECSFKSWGKLPENWDGEGATMPNSESIEDAISFVGVMKSFPVVEVEPLMNASGNAGVFINQDGLYLEIEFHRDGRFVYFVRRGDKEIKGEAKMSMAHWFCMNVFDENE